ncbi:hypothetical protein KPL74_14685 [Bacillus sp. NP157]|nr:hypothetical protein KPL74_14685 [Bacillus sp. NP157]
MKSRFTAMKMLLVMACGFANASAANRAKGISVDEARAKAKELTQTVFLRSHLEPELEGELSPDFYSMDLLWDEWVGGSRVAAFLQIDKSNGNVIQVYGVSCYQYGHDKKMHEVHSGAKLRLPDVCD